MSIKICTFGFETHAARKYLKNEYCSQLFLVASAVQWRVAIMLPPVISISASFVRPRYQIALARVLRPCATTTLCYLPGGAFD